MKKLIPKLIFIVLIVVVVFGGKYVIDHKTYNYRDDVKKSLTEYFISGDVKSLDSIVDLLNKYVDDEEYRGAWASHHGGFSCFRARALGCADFGSCGSWAQ